MIDNTNNQRQVPPSFAEFMDRRMRDTLARTNCHLIGTIVTFDATTQTATIDIDFQRVLRYGTPLEGLAESADKIVNYPRLQEVPVVFLQGGVSYLTFPIAPGDTCILLFNDRDMDNWMATKSVNVPGSTRNHDLNDAIALVGIRSFLNPLANYNTKIASLVDKTGERLAEAGDLKATARSTAPSGWLLCYGQAISRTTYDILFEAIGTTYGAGDGSTTFNVPDLRGRVPVGLDNMGGSNANVLTNTYNPNRNTLGGAIGEEAHQLVIPELPVHSHDVTYFDNSNGGNTGPSMTNPGATGTFPTQTTGSDVPHQNVQPGMMFNWIIKI